MDPKDRNIPGGDVERESAERDMVNKPDAEARSEQDPGMERMRQPIEQRERESEQREHGELTEE